MVFFERVKGLQTQEPKLNSSRKGAKPDGRGVAERVELLSATLRELFAPLRDTLKSFHWPLLLIQHKLPYKIDRRIPQEILVILFCKTMSLILRFQIPDCSLILLDL